MLQAAIPIIKFFEKKNFVKGKMSKKGKEVTISPKRIKTFQETKKASKKSKRTEAVVVGAKQEVISAKKKCKEAKLEVEKYQSHDIFSQGKRQKISTEFTVPSKRIKACQETMMTQGNKMTIQIQSSSSQTNEPKEPKELNTLQDLKDHKASKFPMILKNEKGKISIKPTKLI